jgi:hypothetical protein
MLDPARSAPGHRNGCQGCDNDPATFPPCWTDEQVDEAFAARQESLALSRADRRDVEHQASMLAQQFHETYERLAPQHGYKTRKASAVPWRDVPEQNRNLMVAVCAHLIETGVVRTPSS